MLPQARLLFLQSDLDVHSCASSLYAPTSASPAAVSPTHAGPGYLEIDLDVHNYAFIARKAFHGYIHRLAPVVFENAFVVQGARCARSVERRSHAACMLGPPCMGNRQRRCRRRRRRRPPEVVAEALGTHEG